MSADQATQIGVAAAVFGVIVSLAAAIYRIVNFLRKLSKDGADVGDLVIIFAYLGAAAVLLFVGLHLAGARLSQL